METLGDVVGTGLGELGALGLKQGSLNQFFSPQFSDIKNNFVKNISSYEIQGVFKLHVSL